MSKDIVLGNEINVLSGCPFDSKRFTNEPIGKQLIRIRDLQTFESDTNFSGEYDPLFIVTKGDILIGMDGDFHIVKWMGKEGLLNQRILKLLPKPQSKVDLDYIFYRLQPILLEINDKTAATTVKHLSTTDIKELPLKVPSLPIQQKIAKILSTIDGQIEKTEAIIAKYQAVKQGMLQDLFTRGIDVTTGELRPKYDDAPELYKDSPLGMIPKEWEVVRLDSVCTITTGNKDTQNKIDSGLYPFFVRSQTIERINSYSFDGEAILTSGDGVGVGKIYHYINGKFDFHQRVYMLYDFNNSIESKFLYHYFKTHFLAEVDRYSAKTTVDSVRMEMIAGMLMPCPSKLEQKMAKDFIDSQELVLETEEASLNKFMLLKQGLMSDLLSGKVEVTA